MNRFFGKLKTLGREKGIKIRSFFIPQRLVMMTPAADTRRHMSPTLLSAIRNTSEDHRRSIIQAIREIQDPNKFQTILIALAAEIEITTILENEDLRQFESEMTD